MTEVSPYLLRDGNEEDASNRVADVRRDDL